MVEPQFIDAEAEYHDDKVNYEEIIMKQIYKTAEVLSGDLTSYTQNTKTNALVDSRSVAINHVETLKALLLPFLNPEALEKIGEIKKKIEEFTEEFGNKEIVVYGKGKVKIKNMLHREDSIYMKKLLEEKVDRYKEIFELLIMAYNKKKMEIASFSHE